MSQLTTVTLNGLFNALREELPDELQKVVEAAQDLAKPVGSGEYQALEASDRKLEVTDGQVEIFQQPFSVSGKLAADLLVHAPGAEVPILTFLDPKSKQPVFDEAEILTAPENAVLSELRFEAGAGIEGKLEVPASGGLTLSANASAGGGLVYRHLRPSPVDGDVTRFVALRRLLASSRPPALVPLILEEVAASEIHVLEARVNFDLGLDATFGGNVKLEKDLGDLKALSRVFDGMPAELKVDVDYSLQASFGYSLYQNMQVAVGRFNLLEDGWLRMRIQRLRRSELTLGAKLDLQVEYDLAQDSFTALFDRILALDPTKNFMKALTEVQELRAGGWDAVRDKLEATLGTEVDKLLGSIDWRQWISDQDAAKINGLLDELQKIIKAYDELPQKIQSLWDTLLSKSNLGPDSKVLAALNKIKAIDPQDPTAVLGDLLNDEWKAALSLLETLTGLSLDDLLVNQASSVSAALAKARDLAAAALRFVDDVPAKAIDLIQSFADRTGIEPTVAWLRSHATSVDSLVTALKSKADEQIQQLVSRLVGKAWDAINPEDLEKLGEWLDRIQEILDQKDVWEQKIRGYLNRLRGELGFSFSLEMSRLTERSAVVDLEFDPSNKDVTEAVRDALVLGQARKLLAELPEGDIIEEAGYRIREAVFSSRRVRTSAMSVIFSLFGLQRSRQTTRIDEQKIRVTQDGGRLVRTGSYEGGAVRTLSDQGKKSAARTRELGTWLSLQAAGGGGDVESPYDRGMQQQALRLTFSRRDDDTQPGEITALQTLLSDLGFPVQSTQLAGHSGMPITDLALSLQLGQGAVAAFLSAVDDAGWNTDCLNAGHRWYDEELVRQKTIKKIRAGRVLAGLLETRDFQVHWANKADFLNNVRTVEVPLPEKSVTVSVVRSTGGRFVVPPRGIYELVESRTRPLNKLASAQTAYADLNMSSPDPKAMRQLAARFSTAMARTAFLGKVEPNVLSKTWSNALFNLWLAFTRVGRLDPAALADARGLAVLRFKAKAEDDWQEPLRWQLTDGLPTAGLSQLFPIVLHPAALYASPPSDAVASKNSKFFHASLSCPGAQSIKDENRVFGESARENRIAHCQ